MNKIAEFTSILALSIGLAASANATSAYTSLTELDDGSYWDQGTNLIWAQSDSIAWSEIDTWVTGLGGGWSTSTVSSFDPSTGDTTFRFQDLISNLDLGDSSNSDFSGTFWESYTNGVDPYVYVSSTDNYYGMPIPLTFTIWASSVSPS